MRSDTTIRRETDIRQKILLHKIKIDQIQEEKMKYYIGVDLGTSAVKLLLMDQEGQVVNIVSREYPLSFPHPGWSEQNPDDWWEQSKEGIRELISKIDAAEVAGISFGGQMHGLVILDEAYADFSNEASFLQQLDEFPNLIILQTFSKAWGCAGIRLGMAFASQEIINLLNKIKYPYNVNRLTQQEAIHMIEKHYQVQQWVESLLHERTRLMQEFQKLACCRRIYPTDANFFLTRVSDAKKIYNYLVDKGIIVRNRSSVTLCQDCLRITIGTRPENDTLLEALKNYKEEEA